FHRTRCKLAEMTRNQLEQVVMIGDTMETDIRGAFEAGMQSYLVLSGSTQLEDVADHVYQPTRILGSVAELTEEIKTGKSPEPGSENILATNGFRSSKAGFRHQTDIFALHKPRPRPAMTK
ncbi:MAG TPA: HAD hydrolase-like protein, partial [Verrucomicrobiae bacterium]|nr:HAD hydrolase-like protein [Verrucomicrobiae bacterium]